MAQRPVPTMRRDSSSTSHESFNRRLLRHATSGFLKRLPDGKIRKKREIPTQLHGASTQPWCSLGQSWNGAFYHDGLDQPFNSCRETQQVQWPSSQEEGLEVGRRAGRYGASSGRGGQARRVFSVATEGTTGRRAAARLFSTASPR